MIEDANSQLKGFFNYMVNTIIPKECSAHNQNEAKKSIVRLCYLIAGLRNKFVNQHKLKKNILHIYNIDDYYSIHEVRRPDTVSTLLAKHFAIYVAKPVNEFPSIPLVFNGISIHNSLNIEASRICWYLINKYTGVFDLSYLQKHSIINQFDRIEMLIIHNYNNNITERKEE
ncbi:hypothetical protein Glove_170g12 [Diversispora epigaea]|uniref:Uncharacterized protein n=1 Tax=Diversispora epigaea TaxID=1348612 RepID=A0A397IYX4_9GLOM|nr:hypothetical protein Glove_170g12 [Diversispora epigaea]